MTMALKEAYAQVLKSKEYSEFKKKIQGTFLTHCFTTIADNKQDQWQFGFYDDATDKVSVFEISGADVIAHPPQEVYKEPNHHLTPIYIDEASIPLEDALKKIDSRMKEEYKGEVAGKMIVILQHIPESGLVWNITVLSLTFHVINFKLDAKSGKIVHEQRELLTMWKK